MLWFVGPKRRPPQGRIDGVIYYGGGSVAVDYSFFAVDLVTGNMVQVPTADMPGGPPAGPAGGDLSGTYPNPSVDNVPDGALSSNVPLMSGGVLPAVDGSLLVDLTADNLAPGGTLPALDGSALIGVPPAVVGNVGTCYVTLLTLDGSGQQSFGPPSPVGSAIGSYCVASYIDAGNYVLRTGTISAGTYTIVSAGGAADSGARVAVIVCYY